MVERLKSLRNIIRIGDWEGEFLSRENKIWTDNIMIGGKIVNKSSTKRYVINTIREYLKSGVLPEVK
jgi:hypothetical protein